MKSYSMIGNSIGIVVRANDAKEAMEIAERTLLQGYGGEISFCDTEDKEEYEAWED